MTSTPELDTRRLRLRPLATADLEPLSRLQQNPQMMRFMADGHVHDREETEVWLRWHIDLWDHDGFSLFAVDLKPEMHLIGWIGPALPHWFPEMMPTPEIGWFIDRAHWGQGLATEGAGKSCDSPSTMWGSTGCSASTTPRIWRREG